MNPYKNVLCMIHRSGSYGKGYHRDAETVNINGGDFEHRLCHITKIWKKRLGWLLNQKTCTINSIALYLHITPGKIQLWPVISDLGNNVCADFKNFIKRLFT